MRVLVTGGAGYVGVELVRALAGRRDLSRITVYDNLSHGRNGLFFGPPMGPTPVRFVRGDVLDSRALGRELRQADVVVHLAARVLTPFADGDPHAFEQVNHWGTAELSYALEQSEVRQVIYLSSASVYGASTEPLDEHATPRPRTWYGMSKLRGEAMLTRLADRLDVQVIRSANVFGWGASARFDAVINRFLRQAHFEGRVVIEGDGTQKRPFVPVSHVVRTLDGLVARPGQSATRNLVAYNLSVREIVGALRELYPAVETLFVEQDMNRHSLEVLPSPSLPPPPREGLVGELAAFAKNFAF